MTQAGIDHLPLSNDLTDVKSEHIRILFAAIPSSLCAILICSAVLSIAQWRVIDHQVIIGWFTVTNLLSLVRYYMFRIFQQQQRGRLVDNIWAQYAILTSLVSGATWGAGGFLLFAEQSPVHQVFLAFVITGICAGAITTLSSLTMAARGFVTLAILPIIIKFNLIGDQFSLAMTIMSLLFVAMILVSSQRLNQTIHQANPVPNYSNINVMPNAPPQAMVVQGQAGGITTTVVSGRDKNAPTTPSGKPKNFQCSFCDFRSAYRRNLSAHTNEVREGSSC